MHLWGTKSGQRGIHRYFEQLKRARVRRYNVLSGWGVLKLLAFLTSLLIHSDHL